MSLSGEVFSGGATTSQHIEAQDDDHFENTTFKLKRTRSMGLLDEFIPDKLKEQDGNNSEANSSTTAASTTSSRNLAAMAAIASQTNSSYVNETPSSQHHETIESISNNSDGDVTHSSDVAPSSTSPVNSPSPTSSPALDLKSPELLPHDDTDLAVEPSRHVDYLSHQWDVSDIWKSWRYVISKRKDVANAARLENASWRTWAQRRSNLKTISPEVVNWSKDSDVTWLYGPILKDDDHVNNENHDSDAIETTATSSVAGDISIAKKCSSKNGPKPILKKRTMEQSMISHSNLLKLQLATQIHQKKREQKLKQQEELKRQHQLNHPDEYFDPEALSNKLNSQYKNTAPTHNTSVAKLQSLLKTPNSSSSASLKDLMKDEAVVVPSSEQISHDQNQEDGNVSGDVESKGERHIHFNDEVMQCIAIDVYSDDEQRYDSDEEDYDSDDDDDDYYDQYEPSNDSLAQSHLYEGDDESIEEADEEVEDDEDGSEDEEDDEGGFFLNVKSNSNAPIILGQHSSASTSTPVAPSLSRHTDITDDTASISTTNSKSYKTIQLLPSTSINYGSDESSDEANPYTSSLSHNVNNDISRGYDYYYDYNTVYTCNPNNSVYASYQSPDVVDVPENLDMGSNFDYEFIENNDSIPVVDTTFENNSTINNMPISYSSPSSPLSVAISGGGKNSGVTVNSPNFPIVNVNSNPQQQQQSQAKPKPKTKASPFQLSDSEDDSNSDSDDDGISGLSIGTRRSSQALAESVFQSSLTSSTQETAPQHFPDAKEIEPVAEHVSSINPRYSSTSISKQPTSSSSLSQSFFGGAGGLSSTDKELSKSFLGGSTSASTSTSHDEKTTTIDSSSTGFFQVPNRDYTPSPDNNTLTRTLSNTSKKSSPLPPQTTSENAFRGDGQQSQSQSQSQSQESSVHKKSTDETEQKESNQLLTRKSDILNDLVSNSSEEAIDSVSPNHSQRKRRLSSLFPSSSPSPSPSLPQFDDGDNFQCDTIDVTESPDYSTVVRHALDIKTSLIEKDVSTQVDKTIANSSTQDENTTTTSPTKHLEKTPIIESGTPVVENPVSKNDIFYPKLNRTKSKPKSKSRGIGRLLEMFSNDREIISPKLDKEGSTLQNESLQSGYYISQDKHGDVRASPNNHPPDNEHNDSDFEFDNFDWPSDDVVTASTVVTYSQAQEQKSSPSRNANSHNDEISTDNEINKSKNVSNLSKRVNTNDMADSLEKLHLSETNNKRLPETNTVEVDELTKLKPIINEGNSGIHSQSPTKPLSELHDQIDLTRSGSSHNIIEAQEQKVDNERQQDQDIEPFTQETELLMFRLPSELQTPISRDILLKLTKRKNPNNEKSNDNGDVEVGDEIRVVDTVINRASGVSTSPKRSQTVVPPPKQGQSISQSAKINIRTPQVFTRNNTTVSKGRIKVTKNVMRLLNSSDEEEDDDEEEEEDVKENVQVENNDAKNTEPNNQNNKDKTPSIESTSDPANNRNESNQPEMTQQPPQIQRQEPVSLQPHQMPEQEAVIYQPSNQDASNNRSILLSSPVQPQQKVSQTLELTNRNNITSDKTNANVSWEDDIEDSDPEFFKEMDINYDLVLASKAGKSKTDEIALDKHTNDEIISSVQIESVNDESTQVTNHHPHDVVIHQSKINLENHFNEKVENKKENETITYQHIDPKMISNGEDIDVLMSDIESDVSITNQVNQVTSPIQELKVNEDVASANDPETSNESESGDSEDNIYNRLKYVGGRRSLASAKKSKSQDKEVEEDKDIKEPQTFIHTIKLSPQILSDIIEPTSKTFMHTIELPSRRIVHTTKLPRLILKLKKTSTETTKETISTQLPENLESNLESMNLNENGNEPTKRATTANITSSTEVPAAFPVLSQKSPTPAPSPVNTIVNKPEEQNEGIVTQSEKFPTMKPIEDLPIIKKDTNQLDRIIPDNATNRTRSSSVEQVRSQFNEKLSLDKTNNVKDVNNVETSEPNPKTSVNFSNNLESQSKGDGESKNDRHLSKPGPVIIDLTLDDESNKESSETSDSSKTSETSASSDSNDNGYSSNDSESNNNSESSDDSDRGNKNFSGDEAEEVNNEIDIECDDGIDDNDDDDDGEGNLGDNIDSATINKEPELDESNISDVIKQNIELSSDILICGDKVAPGALATAFEKLSKNDKLRKSFLSKFSPSDEKDSNNTIKKEDLLSSKEITPKANNSLSIIDSNKDILTQIQNRYRQKYEKLAIINKIEESTLKDKLNNSIALTGDTERFKFRHWNQLSIYSDTAGRSVSPTSTTRSGESDESDDAERKIRRGKFRRCKVPMSDSESNSSSGDIINGERNQNIVKFNEIENNIVAINDEENPNLTNSEDDKVEDEDSCCDNSSDSTFEIDKFDFDLTSIFKE